MEPKCCNLKICVEQPHLEFSDNTIEALNYLIISDLVICNLAGLTSSSSYSHLRKSQHHFIGLIQNIV